MSAPDVRDLFDELVAPLATPDLAPTAWREAARRRRHRRNLLGAGVATAALVVAVGAVYATELGDGAGPAQPGPTSTAPPDGSEGTFEGFALWRAPGFNDEAFLPPVPAPLPSTIDLSEPNPSIAAAPVDRAVAAFAIAKVNASDDIDLDGVMFVTTDGQLRHLDAPQLAAIPNPRGDEVAPFGPGSLSPDGTRLAVRARDGVAVYTLATNTWASFDAEGRDRYELPRWSDDGGVLEFGSQLIDPDTGDVVGEVGGSPVRSTTLWVDYFAGVERAYGDRRAITAAWLNEHLRMPGVDYPSPAVIALGDGVQALLVIPDQRDRWKDCCPVAGWLDDDTVVYESRFGAVDSAGDGGRVRLLAWEVETGDVGLVSTVTGSRDMIFVGSYATLHD